MQPGALFVFILAVMIKTSVCGSSPSKPQNVTATVIPPYNVMVTWKEPLNDDNSSLTYTVFYKAKGKGWDEKTVVGATKAILSTKPFRTYEIFVMAEANGLLSVPSARVYNVTTPPAVPGSCPTITDIVERHPNGEIGVQWNEIPEDDQNGPNFGYIIYYKNCSMDKLLNYTINGAAEYQDIANIGPDPYGFKVVAYNSVGLCTKNPEPLDSEERYKPDKYMTCKSIPSVLSTPSTHVKKPSESNTERPAEKLANSKDCKWLMYVAIALAVIVVIMGVAIFLLIWQLYKNRSLYQLQVREQQYRMPRKHGGHDNRAQENPYVENEC